MRYELEIFHLLNITGRDLVEPQSINTVAFRIHIRIHLAHIASRECKSKLVCNMFSLRLHKLKLWLFGIAKTWVMGMSVTHKQSQSANFPNNKRIRNHFR